MWHESALVRTLAAGAVCRSVRNSSFCFWLVICAHADAVRVSGLLCKNGCDIEVQVTVEMSGIVRWFYYNLMSSTMHCRQSTNKTLTDKKLTRAMMRNGKLAQPCQGFASTRTAPDHQIPQSVYTGTRDEHTTYGRCMDFTRYAILAECSNMVAGRLRRHVQAVPLDSAAGHAPSASRCS